MSDKTASHLTPMYRAALVVAFSLNGAMILVEGGCGLFVGSAALLADAVDFIEDAAMLGIAILAIGATTQKRAVAGVLQGLAMALMGFAALGAIAHRLLSGGAPSASAVGVVAVLALAVNLYCAYRLVPFRRGDSSMSAVWLSARNDALLNMLTIIAAGAIYVTHAGWPDIAAGAVIAAINLWAAAEVLTKAIGEMRRRTTD